MIIQELVCKPDGTQEFVSREVPDDFFTPPTPEPTVEEKQAEQIRAQNATITMLSSVMNDILADLEALRA